LEVFDMCLAIGAAD